MSISRRQLISAAAPVTASLICRPALGGMASHGIVRALREKLTGRLYTPADPGYDEARVGKGPTPVDDRFPRLVVQPQSSDDIARTLEFARTYGLDISVRSGGHDTFGASTTPSGVVIDLCGMDAVQVDPATGIARAGAGARAMRLSAAGEPYGRAPVLGINGDVGLGGLTLGGGIGWFCGSHGATVDNLLAVELVTADGHSLRASARENPELFWGLRGGGANLGVATAFTYQLQAVSQVLAGSLAFKTDVPRFLRFLREFLSLSPDALDMSVSLPVQPRDTVTVRLCWSGAMDEGERVLAALKAFSPLVADTVKPQTYANFGNSTSAVGHQCWRGGELDGLSDHVIDTIAGILDRGGPEACALGVLHYMHGALCRVPAGSTPLIRQPGHILYHVVTGWQGPTHPQEKIAWVLGAADQMRAINSEQTYINYLSYIGGKPVHDAYGPYFGRLRAIKRQYDPQNVFHNNRNIRA